MPRKAPHQDPTARVGQQFALYRTRVGSRPIDRLTWALRLAQRPRDTITAADWENIRHEIAASLETSGHRGESVQSVHLPDVGEAQEIQVELATFFGKLLRGEEIYPKPSLRRPTYRLNRGSGRWERWELGTPDLVDALLEVLIPAWGHLIRECAALRVRGKGEERCGTWFVAWRPYQIYCSARCHNRAGARAFRERAARRTNRRRARARSV